MTYSYEMIVFVSVLLICAIANGDKHSNGYPCWEKKADSFSPSLTPAPSYGLKSCMRYCIGIPNCRAISFSKKSDPPCSIQSSGDVVPELQTQTGTSAFLLDRSCIMPRIIPYGPDQCWRMVKGLSYGDLEGTDDKSLRTCLNHCAGSDGCQIVDFNPGSDNPCSVQTQKGPIEKEKFKKMEGIFNFVLNSQCLAFFNYSEIENRDYCWTRRESTVYEGLEKVDKFCLRTCLNFCAELEGCEVANYEIAATPPCSILKNGAFSANSLKPNDAVESFQLDRSCL